MIYRGNKAKEILKRNLDDRAYNECKGYYGEGLVWVAFDNSYGNCWVEEFQTEEMAICWLEGYFEIFEVDEFELYQLQNDIFLMPEEGLLKIVYEKDSVIADLYPIANPGLA